ncbi:MAG: methyltransferase domain-containing protein [Candidatus Hydrogenedentes bacterium]|nr:methyltransferase domain-containing protein [Candidatus Hydrogenedentota bacterium]
MKKSPKKDEERTRRRYAQIAAGAERHAGLADPVAHAASFGYPVEELNTVPVDAVMSLGCGNPVALARIRQGEVVLDLGCGGGLDAILAARRVGPEGRVIGVDATPELVTKAIENARKAGLENVEFRLAQIEGLPLDDASVDVAISNCVMNHCADKARAFKEVYRVLRPRGRMCISDLVIAGAFSEDALNDDVWGEWLTRAQSKGDYLRAIENAGFREVVVEGEATFPMAEDDERLKGRIVSIGVTARK